MGTAGGEPGQRCPGTEEQPGEPQAGAAAQNGNGNGPGNGKVAGRGWGRAGSAGLCLARR